VETPDTAKGKPKVKTVNPRPTAEVAEESDLAKGNSAQQNRSRTQRRRDLQRALDRVRLAAQRDRGLRFTTLWHHVYNIDRLREAYLSLKRNAAPGVDGETWQQYGQNLEQRLRDLSTRLQRGAYRAKPVRRVYIPKPDGRQRPLGVSALEDKIVQRATVEVLNAIYETDFLGFSYGFRPGRGQHNALDALTVGLKQKKVNWVLDADIQGFFDAISWSWLTRFIEHRIADQRVLRHVNKWLNAGVLEQGERTRQQDGTPQGASISPLLANIYLHYVFDLWAHQWRRRQSRGDMVVVRFADDLVVAFQYRKDAERFQRELRERFRMFNLELHPDKTRLIEFGRFAAANRKERGRGKPETFNFLGLTHISGTTKSGKYQVVRQTMRTRLRGKLQEVKVALRRRLHDPVPEVGKWLASVLRGHYRYYGVPGNWYALSSFRYQVIRLWFAALRRRSQRTAMTWDRMKRLAKRWLPYARIQHPYPERRLIVNTRGRSPVS
jgi:group II intron reverse transcriptase/maturase